MDEESHQKETKPNKQQRRGGKPNRGRGGSKEQPQESKNQNQERRGGKQNRGGRGGGIGAVIAGNISNVSSGISITIVLSMMFFISLLIAPYKGLLGVWLRGRK